MPRRKINEDPALRETKCCICGRVFVPAPQHVFRRNGKWCCRWTCYSKLLAELEANKKRAGRPKKKKKGEDHGDQKDHQPVQEQ